MLIRILFSVLLLISILFSPFYVSVIIGILGIIYFKFYFEAIILFFLSDMIFGTAREGLFSIVFISSVLSLVFLILTEIVKTKIRILL
ncbi:MAG: hypothetical protein WCX79_03315 [Candidatus Paceibacterota bacterium]|jgi:hypothetical protein